MMESTTTVSDAKYHKLASEYAKLRAQASVLKKALLEEQARSTTIRENLRQRETALRRCEQEVDSLGFRNKQLEHRVTVLQEEIAEKEGRKREKEAKRFGKVDTPPKKTKESGDNGVQDTLIFEELQKKIMENAQLTSLIADKEQELQLHSDRVVNLEITLEKYSSEQSDLEKRLRRDLETLQSRNSELETKLVEAASMIGSEDALSAAGSDNTPLQNTLQNHAPATVTTTESSTSDERISALEKEVSYWRTQYEIVKLHETFCNNNKDTTKQHNSYIPSAAAGVDTSCSCSSSAAGITVKASSSASKSSQRMCDSLKETLISPTKEQIIYNNLSKKYEDLLLAKCYAESHVNTFETEVEHLQVCLENAKQDLKMKDEQMQNLNRAMRIIEEDLTTTRVNYEQQISVLTEQVINLSEQLAACK